MMQLKTPPLSTFRFSIISTVPPPTDPATIMQRPDEVNSVQRMLSDPQTSAVILTGNPGAGKSTLAALLYRRLQLSAQAGMPAPRHFVWLSLGANTTLPDVIAAILSKITRDCDPSFFLLKSEAQISLLAQALRRPQEQAFVVLDSFESLLDQENLRGLADRGSISLFLDLLQTDLGGSRALLTSYRSPYALQNRVETHVRSYFVSRISIPEGVTLLQQRGLKGSYEELSLVWQRCGGHAFALVLFSTLVKLSGFSPSFLLSSPDYQHLWSSEVALHLFATLYCHLNPMQLALMRTLCLLSEPRPAQDIFEIVKEELLAVGNSKEALEHELRILTQLSLVQQLLHDEPCYELHPLLRQYVTEHYLEMRPGNDAVASNALRSARSQGSLEGNEQQQNQIYVTSLGVSGPVSAVKKYDEEAQRIAVAAGHRRVAAYYQQLAQKHCPPYEERHGHQDIEFLLSTVRHLCLGWHWQQACDLLIKEKLHESMVEWGAWNTLICLYKSILAPEGKVTPRDEGIIHTRLGLLYNRLDDSQQSFAHYEQGVNLQRQIGDRKGEATTLTNRGEFFRMQGQRQQARTNFEQALLLNKQLHDPMLQGVLLHNLGLLHHAEKEYEKALRYYQDALKLMRSLQESYAAGMILTDIGLLLYELERSSEAVAVLRYTIQLRKSLNDPTAGSLEHFLAEIEQKMRMEAIAQPLKPAPALQEQAIQGPVEKIQPVPTSNGQSTDGNGAVRFLQQATQDTVKRGGIPPLHQNQQVSISNKQSTGGYDDEQFQQVMQDTVKHVAISSLPQNQQVIEAGRPASLQQSILETLETRVHRSIRPLEQPGKSKQARQPSEKNRKMHINETTEIHEAIDGQGRRKIGTSELWSDGSFSGLR